MPVSLIHLSLQTLLSSAMGNEDHEQTEEDEGRGADTHNDDQGTLDVSCGSIHDVVGCYILL